MSLFAKATLHYDWMFWSDEQWFTASERSSHLTMVFQQSLFYTNSRTIIDNETNSAWNATLRSIYDIKSTEICARSFAQTMVKVLLDLRAMLMSHHSLRPLRISISSWFRSLNNRTHFCSFIFRQIDISRCQVLFHTLCFCRSWNRNEALRGNPCECYLR